MRSNLFLIVAALSCAARPVFAAVTEYTDRSSWQNAVGGNYTDISFTGFSDYTPITNQYSDLGVTFTDTGGDFAVTDPGFLNDQWGLWGGHLDPIDISLSQPIRSIGVDFPGLLQFRLYYQGDLVYESNLFGNAGIGWFGGLISDQPFDSVRIFDPVDHYVYIDDLYFGAPIPAPGAVALLAIAGISPRRRRRRA